MNKYIRLCALLVCDALLVAASVYLSYLLRFDFSIKPRFVESFPYVMSMYIILILGSFYGFKIYKRIWQYASVGDLIAIIKGAFVGSITFFLIHQIIFQFELVSWLIPRSIYLLTTMICFLAVGGSRFLWRLFMDNYIKIQPHHRRALIVGAGEVGVMVVRELKHSHSFDLYPVAFIDDDIQKQKYEVLGIPVVGTRDDIHDAVKRYKIDDIIVAIPTASKLDVSEVINLCKNTGCQIKIVPRMNDLINGKLSLNMIRDVSVEDLLGREPVHVDLSGIADYLADKVVLITGAGGSIGSELCRQVVEFNPRTLLLLGHGENSIYDIEFELKKNYPGITVIPIIADIQDIERMKSVFAQYKPEVVYHAAAHKHVPLMECNPLEAIKNNVLGTKNVVDCAHEFKSERFVMISTDKAVNPTNVMGATKRMAEMIVVSKNQISETCYSAVRFGNVLGSRGSVIPMFKKQIAEGGPVTVTHPDMIRYFMTIPEAVQLVIQAGALSKGGEIFVLDMNKPIKIADLAHDLIRLSGLEPGTDINVVYTGIRPGEKLFEEILTSEESTGGTKHERIYIGKAEIVPNKIIEDLVSGVKLINNKSNPDVIKKMLKHWVPTYKYGENNDELPKEQREEVIRASIEMVAALDKI
jgi:FlaA1/EpsC-like NDP-sugar epimerase